MNLSFHQGRTVIAIADETTFTDDTTADGDPFDGLPIPRVVCGEPEDDGPPTARRGTA